MLSHYFTVAVRSARRAPLAAAVNVLTLGLGLACFLTAHAFVAFLERAESAFADADRTYVLTTSFAFLNGTFARSGLTSTPEVAAELLRVDFPELVAVARAFPPDGETPVASGARAVRLAAAAADPQFLDIFALPFAAGDARSALAAPGSAVITREAAAQLFGTDDPIGRPLVIAGAVDATITGVIDSFPEPSHIGRSTAAPLRFDLLVSVDVRDAVRAAAFGEQFAQLQRGSWAGGSAFTYVLLPESGALSRARDLTRQLAQFVVRRVPETERATMNVTFDLLPVGDLLRNSIDDELFSGDFGVSVSSVLQALGLLVLAVACVNYANLAIARAARRVREVGVRKALGAGPPQIALQHLLEAAVLTGIALGAAFAVLRTGLPLLETLSGLNLGAVLFDGPGIWLFLAVLAVAATLAAGAYPAFVLARVAPIGALRASLARLGAQRFSAVLVGAQFAAASLLLIAVTVTTLQNSKLVRTGLGAVTDPLLLIENPSRTTKVDSNTLRQELQSLPQVRGVAEAGGLPWQRLVAITFVKASPEETAAANRVLTRTVGHDFFAVLDIDVLAGRVFDAERDAPRTGPPPADAQAPIVVDRAFVEQFDLGTPEQALGRSIYYSNAGFGGNAPMQIIGVVENRRLTFRGAGAAAALYGLGANLDVTYVRIAASDVAGALDGIDAVWSRLAPNVAISRRFFDDTFNAAYERFLRLNQVFGALSLVALGISTAGLVGMATLVAGQRRREVGIRKSFGASTGQMVLMLLRTFVRPVIVANAIVWPLAYFAARAYLDAFIDPVVLGPLPFVLALAATLAIAGLAAGSQTLRCARLKPAEVLRNE